VLLVDEVLSVGDFVFQRKCMDRMREVMRQGTTVLLVSHNLRAVTDLCGRALLLDHGRVAAEGEAPRVVQAYLGKALAGNRDVAEREAYVARVAVRGEAGETRSFRSGERVRVDIEVTARTPCERLSISLDVLDEEFRRVFNTSTERLGQGTIALGAGGSFRCSVQLDLHLAPGTFYLGLVLYRYDIQREYDRWSPAATLLIAADRDVYGIANLYPRVVTFEPA
jgi:hypothetical protein